MASSSTVRGRYSTAEVMPPTTMPGFAPAVPATAAGWCSTVQPAASKASKAAVAGSGGIGLMLGAFLS